MKDLASVSLKNPVRIFVNSNTDVAPFLRQEFIRIRPNREGDREAIVAGEGSGLDWAGWASALRLLVFLSSSCLCPFSTSSHSGTACYLAPATSSRRRASLLLPFPQPWCELHLGAGFSDLPLASEPHSQDLVSLPSAGSLFSLQLS